MKIHDWKILLGIFDRKDSILPNSTREECRQAHRAGLNPIDIEFPDTNGWKLTKPHADLYIFQQPKSSDFEQ